MSYCARVGLGSDLREPLIDCLRPGSIQIDEYYRFWFQEASRASLPIARIIGLVEWFQSKGGPQSDNFFDIAHAQHLLRHDVLLTADRNLRDILMDVSGLFPKTGTALQIDRESASPASAIAAALQAVNERRR